MATQKMRLVLAVALLAAAGWGHAATLLQWSFDGLPNASKDHGGYDYGNDPRAPVATAAGYASTTGFRRGPGVSYTGTSKANAWGGSNFTDQSLTEAVERGGGVYFAFDIIAEAGHTLSLYTIETAWSGSRLESPLYGQWQYLLYGETEWVDIPGGQFGEGEGYDQSLPHGSHDWIVLDLTGEEALQNLTTSATFRFVAWGGEGTNGRFYFGTGSGSSTPNTFTVTGDWDVVPEPSSAALLVLSGAALLLRRKRRQGRGEVH